MNMLLITWREGENMSDQQHKEIIEVMTTNYNMQDYEDTYNSFSWEEVEKVFTWSTTGKVNAAYEAIDRHALSDKKDKVALLYSDASRKESYTFGQMKELSDKFGNVLRSLGIQKGDRVFIFMPRTPE